MKTLLTDLQHSIAQAPEHRHCHMTCEMVYVKRGRARFSIAGVDYTAGPGCLVLISPLEEHSVRALLPASTSTVAPPACISVELPPDPEYSEQI